MWRGERGQPPWRDGYDARITARERAMQIGIGLDARLNLAASEQHAVVRQAARLGYTSAWTPSSTTGRDSCFTCAGWNAASTDVTPGGLQTGILVVPAPTWTAPTLAALAGTVGEA